MKLIDILPYISGFYSVWLNSEAVEDDTEYLNNEVIDVVAAICTNDLLECGLPYPEVQIHIR